jgi:hypothetical protein
MESQNTPPEVGGVWENIQLLAQWSPLISILKQIVSETDIGKQSVYITDAIEWLASKSKNKIDDELAAKVAAVVRTPQGIELIKFVVRFVEGVAK